MTARTRLLVALLLAVSVAAFEFWGGAAAHSLALTTDAVHVCMDVFALALALLATVGAAMPADRRRTFGYGRIEVLAALANGTILLCATVVIVYEAVQRFGAPLASHGWLMTAVAFVGLVVNGGVGFLLAGSHAGHDHGAHGNDVDLNVQAALFHVVGDAIGAGAVIIGGIVIAFTHAAWIDPALSMFVALVIVVGIARVLRDATGVLLEGTPRGLDIDDVDGSIRGLDGVAGVHDLHVWSIASGSRALSAHVLLDDRRLSEATAVLRALRGELERRFDIAHVTVQFECEHCDPEGVVICVPGGAERG